jgi:hypothetical protein
MSNPDAMAGPSSPPPVLARRESRIPRAQGPAYTPKQMELYFERIKAPQSLRQHPIFTDHIQRKPGSLNHPQSLEYLTALQGHMISSVPFESLHLHYSAKKIVAIDPEDVFKKIVNPDMGRGG